MIQAITGLRKIKLGSELYEPTAEKRIYNAGDEGTTDWWDNSTGLAHGWMPNADQITFSRVTGNGFTGYAQRVETSYPYLPGISIDPSIEPLTLEAIKDNTYVLSIKYRSNALLGWGFVDINGVRVAIANSGFFPINTGNAIQKTSRWKFDEDETIAGITFLGTSESLWFEIDEVRLYKLK